jgi:hypothetical protein
MRQIVTQKIDLPVSTLPQMLKEQIRLNPDFQRRDRWNEVGQARLIESLIMNVPIPPVFLGEDEYGHYVVLDGRQRLTAISAFLKNELKLKGLEVWDELNGMTYQDLIKRQFDKFLTRRFLQAIVVLKESSPIVKYDVFDRLNTGGVRANNMEIRNALYRGGFTDLLHELSRSADFCRLWDIPTDAIAAEQNKMYQQMEDLEIVLRFFALSRYGEMNMRFKDYLTEFMGTRNDEYRKNPELAVEDRAKFVRGARNSWRVFGNRAFLRSTGVRSVPLADAVMIALSEFEPDQVTDPKAAAARIALQNLFNDADFTKAIGTGTNGRGAIETRIEMAKAAAHNAID